MGLPISTNYTLTVNGQTHEVFHTEKADFALLCFSGSVDVSVTAKKAFDDVTVRPLRGNYKPQVSGSQISLTLQSTDRVSIEPYGIENPLFILCSEYVEKPANATHVYPRGSFTDIGTVELKSGDCVYIEEGAVVVGNFTAREAHKIKVCGNGIIWGQPNIDAGKHYQTILFIECKDVEIRDVTLVDSPNWGVVPTACKGVIINDVNVLGIKVSTDAFDIVGCENVVMTHCFACVNDDCVAIKAVHYHTELGARSVRNIAVSDCVFWKLPCGNALEIGYETSGDELCNIHFSDIDIIHCEYEGWQSGAVFSIHNGDRGHVHNVSFKDIHIEDATEKLIDFKILWSKYSADNHRGYISNILLDGIYVHGDILPPSIFRGYEPLESVNTHLVKDVKVRNLYLGDKKITSRLEAHAVVELSQNITFE